MAYIGKTPVIGNFQKCDSISVVNGQAAYTLQVGGVNVSPQSENHMLVSLNGILQAPVDSFTISGSTLTFASNLVTGDVIDFVMILGNVLDLGVPSDNTVSTAKISNSAVTPAKLGYDYNQYRNIIINGDMSIAQRGTSHTTANGYTLDRWHLNDSTSGDFTITQSSTVPSGQGFAKSYKLDCTTADASPDAGEYLIFNQRIEGQNLQYIKKGTSNAESLTLSFWVRSNKTGTYIAELRDGDNIRHNTIAYTISSADTWEKKTITFAGDTSGALDNDNARSLDVNFWLLAGSTFSSGTLTSNTWSSITDANRAVGNVNIADSTSNEWYITGIQLEAGTSASDFEFLPYDVNLRRCMRYCQVLVNGDVANYSCMGFAQSANLANLLFPFYVEPRVPATGLTVQNVDGFGATTVASGGKGSAATFGQSSKYAVHWQLSTSTGSYVAGYPLFLYNYNTALDAKIIFTGMEL